MHTTASARRSRALSIGIPLGVLVLSFAAAWFRLPPASRDTFWAEDATVFSDRMLDPSGLPWSVFTSYDGYVHALPHAIAFVLWHVLPVPIDAMAQVFTAAACLVAAAVAAAVYLVTGAWGLNLPGRLVLAFTTVLVHGLDVEVLGNLANIHWFLLWLAPFVFLARPTRWWTAGVLGATAFVIVTSEVQSALFAPLLLWRVTDRRRWPLLAGAFAGAVIQLIAVLGGGRTSWGEHLPRPLSIIVGYLVQVPLVGVSGTAETASAVIAYSGWVAALAAVVPFALCALWWAWGSKRRLLIAAGIVAASFIIWSAGYALNVSSLIDFPSLERERLLIGVPLLRYAIVPLMLLYAFAGLAIGRQRLTRGSFESAVAGALVVLCATMFAVSYRADVAPPRVSGPTWTQALAAAETDCAGAGAADEAVIWVSPKEFWRWPVPCATVQEWERR